MEGPTKVKIELEKNVLISVEECANYQGNDTELLVSRMHNKTIRSQIIDRFIEGEKRKREWYLNDVWNKDDSFEGSFLRGEKSGVLIEEEYLNEILNHPKSREDIERQFDENLKEIETKTNIEFTDNEPDSDVIPLYYVFPLTGKKLTEKQMSITEAHEKGHKMRFHFSEHVEEELKSAFDISQVHMPDSFYEKIFSKRKREEGSSQNKENVEMDGRNLTKEEIIQEFFEDYLFSGFEILERMSQLKNYFGFRGDEEFTIEHLEYARKHYVEDTELDNGMTMFFEGITKETEETFLRLMNTIGI